MRTQQQDTTRQRHWICAQRLRDRRRELGLTQLAVVQALRGSGIDISNRGLSTMEHGHGLDLGWLPDLADALDCTVTYLLGLTGDPHRWQPDSITTEPWLVAPVVTGRRSWILGPDIPGHRTARR